MRFHPSGSLADEIVILCILVFFRFSETLRVLVTWVWPGWDFIQVSLWWKTNLHFHGTVFDLRKRRKGVGRSMRGCMWRMLSKTGAKPFPRHILAAHIHLSLLSFREGTQRGSERHNEDLAMRMRMWVYFIQTTGLVVADFYYRYRHWSLRNESRVNEQWACMKVARTSVISSTCVKFTQIIFESIVMDKTILDVMDVVKRRNPLKIWFSSKFVLQLKTVIVSTICYQ